MTQTILCAIDINRPNEEAVVVQKAAQLAAMEDAQLDLLTVVPDFGATVVGAYFEEHHVATARDTADEQLKSFAEGVLGKDANANVRHLVAVGSVYQEILHAAKLAGSDLIVLGAHNPDLKDYLLGPNASRVVRHANCSVYVVR